LVAAVYLGRDLERYPSSSSDFDRAVWSLFRSDSAQKGEVTSGWIGPEGKKIGRKTVVNGAVGSRFAHLFGLGLRILQSHTLVCMNKIVDCTQLYHHMGWQQEWIQVHLPHCAIEAIQSITERNPGVDHAAEIGAGVRIKIGRRI
jgi:hypothetical protein